MGFDGTVGSMLGVAAVDDATDKLIRSKIGPRTWRVVRGELGLWLPGSAWPVFREEAAELERLRTADAKASTARGVLRARFDAEDTKVEDELAAAMAEQREPKLPKRTPEQERAEQLDVAERQARLARRAYVEGVIAVLARIQERAPELLAELDDDTRAARAEVKEAEKALRAARLREARVEVKKRWLGRHVRWTPAGALAPLPWASLDAEALVKAQERPPISRHVVGDVTLAGATGGAQ
jgi:hypothetical protein